jgi:hypothetical protein
MLRLGEPVHASKCDRRASVGLVGREALSTCKLIRLELDVETHFGVDVAVQRVASEKGANAPREEPEWIGHILVSKTDTSTFDNMIAGTVAFGQPLTRP